MAAVRTGCRKVVMRAALALAVAMSPGWLQAQMLASIPVELATQRNTSPEVTSSSDLRVRVYAADAAGLARLLGQPEGQDGAAGYVELTLLPGTHPDLGSPANPAAASFIVDFDDPAVVRLSQQLLGEPGRPPIGGAQIVAFVAKLMRSEFAANADLASEVARSLQGDCTEHSLLTAALARSTKISARIVHGAALVHTDGRWQAYGHAWVQTHEAGRWIVRDSALAGWPGPVYYVPALVIVDEGPGYKLGLMQSVGRLPSRIEILDSGGQQPAR